MESSEIFSLSTREWILFSGLIINFLGLIFSIILGLSNKRLVEKNQFLSRLRDDLDQAYFNDLHDKCRHMSQTIAESEARIRSARVNNKEHLDELFDNLDRVTASALAHRVHISEILNQMKRDSRCLGVLSVSNYFEEVISDDCIFEHFRRIKGQIMSCQRFWSTSSCESCPKKFMKILDSSDGSLPNKITYVNGEIRILRENLMNI